MNPSLYGWPRGSPSAGGSGAYSTAVLADAPVRYFRLDTQSGSVEVDSSTNNSGATYSTTVTTATGAISDGNAAQLFSNAQHADLVAALSLPGDFALEWWAKAAAGLSNSDAFFGTPLVGPNVNAFSNTPRLYTGTADVANFPAMQSYYQHYVYSRSGSTVTGYINSQIYATGTWTGTMTVSRFGQANATMDEVAIYAASLSAARVAAHFRAAYA